MITGHVFQTPALPPSGVVEDSEPTTPYLDWQLVNRDKPPSKRARIVHPLHSRLPGCDSCRQRRTKCVRIDPEDSTCKACKARGIDCTTIRSGGVRYKARKPRSVGRKSVAGTSKVDPTDEVGHSQDAFVKPEPESDAWYEAELEEALALARCDTFAPADSTPEGRLSLSEETEAVLGSLLDTYVRTSTWSLPLLEWNRLQDRFERAGRRPRQLDIMTETLVLACITMGAYFSDDPHIVGPDAPRLHDLAELGVYHDLSLWGRRRKVFCQSLVDKVIRQVDRSSCFRIACTESVASLAIAAELISHSYGYAAVEQMRPYHAAANCHLRYLSDQEDAGSDLRSFADRTLAVEDAITSAIMCRALLWSDEDLECVLKVSAVRPLSLAALAADLSAGNSEIEMTVPWTLVLLAVRRFAKDVARKLALGQHIEVSAFQEALSTAGGLLQQAIALHTTIRSSWKMQPDRIYNLDSDPSSHSTTFLAFVTTFILVIRRQFTRWRQERWILRLQELDERSREGEAQAVALVEDTLTKLLAESVTLIGCLIRERRRGAGIEVVTHLSSFAPVKLSLGKWALVALSIPCAEAGGPPGFTAEIQTQTIRILIDAMRGQAWTWSERFEQAEMCEAKFRALLAARTAPPDGQGASSHYVGLPGPRPSSPSAWPSAPASSSGLWDPHLFDKFAPRPEGFAMQSWRFEDGGIVAAPPLASRPTSLGLGVWAASEPTSNNDDWQTWKSDSAPRLWAFEDHMITAV